MRIGEIVHIGEREVPGWNPKPLDDMPQRKTHEKEFEPEKAPEKVE